MVLGCNARHLDSAVSLQSCSLPLQFLYSLKFSYKGPLPVELAHEIHQSSNTKQHLSHKTSKKKLQKGASSLTTPEFFPSFRHQLMHIKLAYCVTGLEMDTATGTDL